MYQYALCDDCREDLARFHERIAHLFRAHGVLAEATLYGGSTELLQALGQGRAFDALFLDINMPFLDGIQLGELVRRGDQKVLLVFLSSHEELVFDTIKLQPFRFVRKRCFDHEIEEAVAALCKALREDHTFLTAKQDGVYFSIDSRDILYIEGRNKQQRIVTQTGEYLVRRKLRDLEQELRTCGFLQIHKGYLVNRNYIKEIHGTALTLRTGAQLPISRDRLLAVLVQLGDPAL